MGATLPTSRPPASRSFPFGPASAPGNVRREVWHEEDAHAGALSYLVIAALSFVNDLHVRFWLGEVPQMALLTAAGALAWLCSLIGYETCLRMYHGLRNRKTGATVKFDETQIDSTLASWKVLFACTQILVLSLASIVLSVVVLRIGRGVSDALVHNCGTEGVSAQLEQVHEGLEEFYNRCQQSADNVGKPVDLCPGFHDAFPAPSPFVKYLMVLEEGAQCVGFCYRESAPLFKLNHAGADRCAARLSSWLWKASVLSGVPSLIVGACTGLVAAGIFNTHVGGTAGFKYKLQGVWG